MGDLAYEGVEAATREKTLEIVEAVRTGGEDALLSYAWKFGELPAQSREYILGKEELKASFDGLPAEIRGVLERTAARITAFARQQRGFRRPRPCRRATLD